MVGEHTLYACDSLKGLIRVDLLTGAIEVLSNAVHALSLCRCIAVLLCRCIAVHALSLCRYIAVSALCRHLTTVIRVTAGSFRKHHSAAGTDQLRKRPRYRS